MEKFQGTNKGEFKCYNCGEAETGHMERQCKKTQAGKEKYINSRSGIRGQTAG
jgi:hypothetical protein